MSTLDESWKATLEPEFSSDYMLKLKAFLIEQKAQGKEIFPKGSEYFRALDLTRLGGVRVVILGQDPYHGDGQAHGLCFSVKPGVRIPPSLVNIYKELQRDLGVVPARHGFLEHWANQGVLLLNNALSVVDSQPASHQGKGWEEITDAIVAAVAAKAEPCVFMLWGSHARKKAASVPGLGLGSHHLILTAPHPSPLSAHTGWFGSGHFGRSNAFLGAHGRGAVDWRL